jgi:hypothetical protein
MADLAATIAVRSAMNGLRGAIGSASGKMEGGA